MDELPANTEVAIDHAGLSSCDPMEDGADPAELLDIDMDEFARILTLVAANRLGLQSAQLVQAQSTQNPTDSGRRAAGLGRDLLAGQALAAESLILSMTSSGVGWGSRRGRELWSSSPARPSMLYRVSHFADSPRADAYGECGGLRRLPT
jgi:hypothetical protein